MKVNTNGLVKRVFKLIVCGGIFRNAREIVYYCFSVFVGNGFAFEAQLWVVISAFFIAYIVDISCVLKMIPFLSFIYEVPSVIYICSL